MKGEPNGQEEVKEKGQEERQEKRQKEEVKSGLRQVGCRIGCISVLGERCEKIGERRMEDTNEEKSGTAKR